MPNEPLSASPADQLRDRLTRGQGRWAVIVATSSVWLMDLLLARHLERDQVIAPALKGIVSDVERAGTLLFVVVSLGLVISLFQGGRSSSGRRPHQPLGCGRRLYGKRAGVHVHLYLC